MPIRITGMNSGLDTEAIITELVKVQKTKGENIKKEQTRLEWKQEAWKQLNSKVYKLFNSTLNNMRFTADYIKKTTELSDPSVAKVVTGGKAMYATQELQVIDLATTAYKTSDEVENATSGSNKLVNDLGITEGSKVKITVGSNTEEITVTADMTIDGFVSKLQSAGLEASFDSKNKRFHIAAKESGEAGNFTIAADDANGIDALSKLGLTAGTVTGNKAHIKLNGVDYYSETNTVEVNGLTITALAKSSSPVTMTTRQDTDGIYNKIKDFFKEYNSLINEMDALYNAESSKGYDPLTDEEKDAMSESEIEKWEKKIKDSVLRGDSNLSTLSSAMKNIMLQGAKVNGEQLYLSNFGIETLGYFVCEDNQRNAYHINGDEDDATVSANENTLKAAIASDPEKVMGFFAQLTQNLYTELNNQSKSVNGIRSFGSFYDDKKMKEDYDNYTTKIKDQEEKLKALEDRWYDKFSAMETAMARLQSNQSAVSGLLGM